MSWRIAVASIDGVLITEHFGRSRWFYIIDVQRDGTGVPVERRSVPPLCEGGGHTLTGMDARIESFKDCVAVLVAKIGPIAQQRLALAGISVFEEPAEIETAVKEVAAYYLRIHKPESGEVLQGPL
ncbi:MAG: dinitrogenase iron-molybdenum cofactor biosynthesis protein [Treponema sp.]|jgi:predicted Fe-Mo cluster-binding NifX family protein|nr:dinitrogenase iron-molybdenum cofactor biosynthesis protein [Treponema sp.]